MKSPPAEPAPRARPAAPVGLRLAALLVAGTALSACALRGEPVAVDRRDAVLASGGPLADPGDLGRMAAAALPASCPVDVTGAAAISPTSTSTADAPLTLAAAVRGALATAESLQGAGEDLHRAELTRILALAQVLPSATWRYTYSRIEEDFNVPPGVRFGGLVVENKTSRFELRQPIFNGEAFATLDTAAPFIAAAEGRLRDVRRLVRLAAARAFYSVLAFERAADTFAAALERDDERLREVRARESLGLARRTEVLFIETDRARARASLDRSREEIGASRARLGLLVGRPASGALVEPPPDPPPPAELAEHISLAHSRRPDLAALRDEVELQRRTLKVAYARYLPTVDVVSNLYAHREGTLEDVSWDVAIEVAAPLFEGFETTARVREAESRHRSARLAYEGRAREIAAEVAGAFHAHRASRGALASREAEVRAAEENFRLLDAEYRLGIASNLELVTAEDSLRQARLGLEIERINERLQRYELTIVTGEEP